MATIEQTGAEEVAWDLGDLYDEIGDPRIDADIAEAEEAAAAFRERYYGKVAELDAAVPDRPVFMYEGFTGPGQTNSLGKAFFESASTPLAGPVTVGADGSIARGLGARLAFIQDEGAAIRGPSRLDLYAGTGDEAGRVAGALHAPVELYLLGTRD